MTALTEQAATGAAQEKQPTCDVLVPLFDIRCGDAAAGRYRRACVHEHIADGWVCQMHVDHVESGLCLACFHLPGALSHECPITLTRIPAVTS